MAAGMPQLANLPLMSSPGVTMVALIGSSRLKPPASLPKPCHLSLDFRYQLSRLPMPDVDQLVGTPDLEPPVLAELRLHLAHRPAELQRLEDRLLDQRGAPGRLHHRRGHVAGRDDRVLRTGRGVHQEGLVEAVLVELARLRLLHQDLRGLRQARQQLVRGLRGEDHRVLAARAVRPDRVELVIELVEGRVRQPRLVEVQRVHVVAQRLLDALHVVEHAVVGALRDRQHPRLGALVLDQRVRVDLAPDARDLELLERNRPDDAQVVARGLQEDRHRAGHDDRVQDRLVAVAVHQHDVVAAHVGVPDDLVRRRRAVGHEEQVIGVEDARRVLLRGGHRPGVIEQLPQLVDRVADVGAQHVLAEELVEHLPHRALQERDPARVPRTVPGVGTVVGVVDQRLEERRRERVQVVGRLADDVARDELRRVLEHVNEAVQLLQDVVGQVLRGARLAEQEDGDVRVAPARLDDELLQFLDRVALDPLLADLLVVDRHHEGRSARRLVGHHRHVDVGEATHHLGALVLERLGQRPDPQPAGGLGLPVFVDDDDGEAEFHGHGGKASCRGRGGFGR